MAFGGRSGNRSFSLSHTVTVAAGERLSSVNEDHFFAGSSCKKQFCTPCIIVLSPFFPLQICTLYVQ